MAKGHWSTSRVRVYKHSAVDRERLCILEWSSDRFLASGHLRWAIEEAETSVKWHLTQSKQTSTHKQVHSGNDEVDIVRI